MLAEISDLHGGGDHFKEQNTPYDFYKYLITINNTDNAHKIHGVCVYLYFDFMNK